MKNILSLIVLYFVLIGVSWGSNFGSSLDGKSANITFSHTSDLDSVHVWFGYDGDGSGADSTNLYYWKKLLPCFGNDKIAMADNVALDSVGTHVLKIVYWPPDGSDSIATGIWLHQGGASDVNVVQISGDATAADNFETMLDGTGGNKLVLSGLHIEATSNDSAIVILGAGTGHGIFLQGGTSMGSHGLDVRNSGSGGPPVKLTTINQNAALYCYATDTGPAIYAWNTGTSSALKLKSTNYDMVVDFVSGSGHGLDFTNIIGAGKYGIYNPAPDSNTFRSMVWDGDTTGHYTAGAFGYEALQGGGWGDTLKLLKTGIDTLRLTLYGATGKPDTTITVFLQVIKDTTDAQGSGGATDTTLIKTVADNNPQIWTDQAGGTGGELCSLLIKDSNGQVVSGLTWVVRDSAGNDLGTDDTDASGWALFNIDQHDSVHLYPKERAGISLATYYAEPVPNNGFCDTITATIWNYTVAGGGMCNLHINTRDLKRRTSGYGRWKMTVEYSKPGGYTDTTGGFLQWGGMEETAFKDSGLLQISVPQTYRALLYDSVTDTYTDSGLVNIRIYREDNLIREIFKVNVPRDSTQYDVLQLMMR